MGSLISQPEPNQDIIIFVVGPAGAGKSYLINTAVKQRAVKVGDSLEPCTTTVQSVRCPYRNNDKNFNVTFVDTPALQQDIQSFDGLKKHLEVWMKKSHVQRETVAGIFFLHKISDNRLTKPSASTMAAFESFCGKDISKKVVLVTTMWDSTEPAVGVSRETEIKTKYWSKMLDSGSNIVRFDNKASSVWSAVDFLIPSHSR